MRRALSIFHQLELMRAHHPSLRHRIVRGSRGKRLVSQGSVRPTPISERYYVRIEYALDSGPLVWVDRPRLRVRAGHARIPHTFSERGPRPCLFEKGDWNDTMAIATSIVPWLLLWLVFYESWLATGEWQGKGHAEASTKIAEAI
jgi:hypothetical protein